MDTTQHLSLATNAGSRLLSRAGSFGLLGLGLLRVRSNGSLLHSLGSLRLLLGDPERKSQDLIILQSLREIMIYRKAQVY